MKKLIVVFKTYLLEIFAGMFLFLFMCWMVGYFGNGLFNTKFDLNSCWAGVASLGGAGTMATVRYLADSWWNTEKGQGVYNSIIKKEEI